ncbi:unnamed protein product [Rangifer tarandus platyrhynchus]|uniref:Uncharacterized protein n=1 Tax=Rangifer tarandus platyrhynchus TaxID=3082113 RepID=A0AC59YSX4_RANTA
MPLGRWEPGSAHPRSRPPLRLSPRRLGAHLARCQPAATPTRFCGAGASLPSFLALRHLSVLVSPHRPPTRRERHSPQWLGFRWASPCAPGPPLRMPPAAGGSASPVLQGFPSRQERRGREKQSHLLKAKDTVGKVPLPVSRPRAEGLQTFKFVMRAGTVLLGGLLNCALPSVTPTGQGAPLIVPGSSNELSLGALRQGSAAVT